MPPVHQPVGDIYAVSSILDVDRALPRRHSGPTGVRAHLSPSVGTADSVRVDGASSHLLTLHAAHAYKRHTCIRAGDISCGG